MSLDPASLDVVASCKLESRGIHCELTVNSLKTNGQVKSVLDGGALESDERWQLALRISASPHFAKAARLRDFLIFVCRNALTHQIQEIHEQRIGAEVFGRPPDYSPAEDNIVRVEARELRKRLAQYFAEAGTAERYRLAIPKGSYVPLFELQAANAELETDERNPGAESANVQAVNSTLPPLGPNGGRDATADILTGAAAFRRLWRAAAIVIVAGAALVATLHWEQGSARAALPRTVVPPASRALQPPPGLWPALFPSGSHINVVVADSALVLVEDITHKTVSLADYANRSYRRNVKGPDVSMIAGRPYTDLADVMVTSKLLQAIHARFLEPVVRYPRDLTFRDLENDNLIFLGSAYSDPWVDEFDAQADFPVIKDPVTGFLCFANSRPLAGEPGSYCASPVSSGGLETFALVTFMPNLQDTGNVLILEGTTGAGTEAAGDFMTNPHYCSRLRSLLGVGPRAKSLPYFQLLLKTVVIDNTPGELEFVSLRFLGKTAKHSSKK